MGRRTQSPLKALGRCVRLQERSCPTRTYPSPQGRGHGRQIASKAPGLCPQRLRLPCPYWHLEVRYRVRGKICDQDLHVQLATSGSRARPQCGSRLHWRHALCSRTQRAFNPEHPRSELCRLVWQCQLVCKSLQKRCQTAVQRPDYCYGMTLAVLAGPSRPPGFCRYVTCDICLMCHRFAIPASGQWYQTRGRHYR